MTDASDLWTAVTTSYDNKGLVTLTNIRDRSQTTIDAVVGVDACQGVIDLWPIYAQEDYDAADVAHVEVAKRGVIALLWSRGGSAATIAKVEWDEVFSPEGLVVKVKRTGPRSRQGPTTNSGVQQKSELTNSGQPVRGWSDPASLPHNAVLPRRVIAED